jgi:phosphoesterase RecJ-like protein
MSFRSKTKFPANSFARQHFNGGGHFNAAGGESSDPIEMVEEKFKAALPEFLEYLN